MGFNFYAYKITRDFGFAPNPFYGYCTLACCKPGIRRMAQPGDWVLATGSVELDLLFHVICLFRVEEVVDFQSYWEDERFNVKRPVIGGNIVQIHGDNIYHKVNGDWVQEDSQHSFEGGKFNKENFDRDISGINVLISKEFYYFGSNHFRIPQKFIELCCDARDYCKKDDEGLITEFLSYISDNYLRGELGEPINWKQYDQLDLF